MSKEPMDKDGDLVLIEEISNQQLELDSPLPPCDVQVAASVHPSKLGNRVGVFTPNRVFDFSRTLGNEDMMSASVTSSRTGTIMPKSTEQTHMRATERNTHLATARKTEAMPTTRRSGTAAASRMPYTTARGKERLAGQSIDSAVFRLNQQRIAVNPMSPPAVTQTKPIFSLSPQTQRTKLPVKNLPMMGITAIKKSSRPTTTIMSPKITGRLQPSFRQSTEQRLTLDTFRQSQWTTMSPRSSALPSLTVSPRPNAFDMPQTQIKKPKLSHLLNLDQSMIESLQGPLSESVNQNFYKPTPRQINFQKNTVMPAQIPPPLTPDKPVVIIPMHRDTLDSRPPAQIYNNMRPLMRSVATQQKTNFIRNIRWKQMLQNVLIDQTTKTVNQPIFSPESMERLRLKCLKTSPKQLEDAQKFEQQRKRSKEVSNYLQRIDLGSDSFESDYARASIASIRRDALTPKKLKARIQDELLKLMRGTTREEKLRNMSLLDIARREAAGERKKFLGSVKVLLEMQSTIQERKFREQVIKADKQTQEFFNELLKTMNKAKLNPSLVLGQMGHKHTGSVASIGGAAGMQSKTNLLLGDAELNLDKLLEAGPQKQNECDAEDCMHLHDSEGEKHLMSPAASDLLKRLKVALQVAVKLQIRLDEREQRFASLDFAKQDKQKSAVETRKKYQKSINMAMSQMGSLESESEEESSKKSENDVTQIVHSDTDSDENEQFKLANSTNFQQVLLNSEEEGMRKRSKRKNMAPIGVERIDEAEMEKSPTVSEDNQSKQEFKIEVQDLPGEKADQIQLVDYKITNMGPLKSPMSHIKKALERATPEMMTRNRSSPKRAAFSNIKPKLASITASRQNEQNQSDMGSPQPIKGQKKALIPIPKEIGRSTRMKGRQYKLSRNPKARNFSVQLDSFNFNSKQLSKLRMQEKEKIDGVKLIHRFQRVVCKKLMNTTVTKLREYNPRQITRRQTFELLNFQRIMNALLEKGVHETLGAKYVTVAMNFFRNDYLRDVIGLKPEFNDHLRVYAGDDDYRTTKIQAVPEDYLREEEHDLNSIFSKQVKERMFYDIVKKGQLTPEQAEDPVIQSYWRFYETSGRSNGEKTPINISLIQFWNKIQHLYNKTVTLDQAIAFKEFLTLSKDRKECKLREMIFDSCIMEDKVLAEILMGAANQIVPESVDEKGKKVKPRQWLMSFINTNGEMGPKSLESFKKLSSDMLEIRLNNIKDRGCNVAQEFLYHMALHDASPFLMKLSLSNMMLNEKKTVNYLIDTMTSKKHLQYLDLSWSSLSPRALKEVTETLQELMFRHIRDLNLSYNQLRFYRPGSEDHTCSLQTVENLIEMMNKAKLLNHVNFSGMGLQEEQLLQVANVMGKSKLLMGLHLSDNGITRNLDLFIEMLDIFQLKLEDVSWRRIEMMVDEKWLQDPVKRKYYEKDQPEFKNQVRQGIDIGERIQQYMRFQAPDKRIGKQKHANCDKKLDKVVNRKRNELKHHLFLGKEFRNYQNYKAMNWSKDKYGIGRATDSMQDQFTLCRVINHPELCFNQRPDYDKNPKQRWFQVDANLVWQFKDDNQCLVCDRYQYTQIHYHRGVLSQNKGLLEIKDKKIIDELRYQFDKDYLKIRSDTPLIMGSIVNKFEQHGLFDRRLKMMRTPMYCLLTIAQCRDFFEVQDFADGLKAGVKMYLKKDAYELLKELDIDQKLRGWSHILSDMSSHNELTDVRSINLPDLAAYNIEAQDWYTFGGFMKPGYHQAIIYDPRLDRAYCKDFVIKLNQRDFVYPEYPIHQKEMAEARIPNVWLPWKDDLAGKLEEIFNRETKSSEFSHYRLESRVVKDEETMKKIMALMKEHFDKILLWQKYLIDLNNTSYPQISFQEQIYTYLIEIQDKNENMQTTFRKAHLELCFMGATNTDGVAGLRGAMQRAELMNFLVRLIHYYNRLEHEDGTKNELTTTFEYIMGLFITPIFEDNEIFKQRSIIRQSKKLNDLLHHNREGLKKAFEHGKKMDPNNPGNTSYFTANCARAFFLNFTERGVWNVTREQIDKYFVYSMMTVADEFEKSSKYKYLTLIEWKEMFCRLCLVGSCTEKEQEPLAYKVEHFLKGVWQYFYQMGHWERTDKELEFNPIASEFFAGDI